MLYPEDLFVHSTSQSNPEPVLVLLDAGIVTELTPRDLQGMLEMFDAVAQCDGARAADCMIEHSRDAGLGCIEPQKFKQALDLIVQRAHTVGGELAYLGVSKMLQAIMYLCYRHHVQLESRYASVVIACGIVEGVGLSLDGSVDILASAAPWVLEAQQKQMDQQFMHAMASSK